MKTNIDIDDTLFKNAIKASKGRTKKEAVEKALNALIQREAIRETHELRGKVEWEGDLGFDGLASAYGEDEPDYSDADIKEPNPDSKSSGK